MKSKIWIFTLFLLVSCSFFDKQVSYFDEVQNSITKVVAKLSSSVVYLEIVLKGRHDKEEIVYANGCFIDEEGHLLTVSLEEKKIVRLNVWYKTKKYEAYIIKDYRNLGYSVVRFIPPEKTIPIIFADTDFLKQGSFIYGVGATGENLSFEPIINFGTISAIISQRVDIIIHNGFPLYSRKGFSTLGMPIANRKGEVIGFTSRNLIITNEDAKIVQRKFFERDEKVNDDLRPWIGVLLETITEDEAQSLKVVRSGLKVTRVYYDSPASKQGIKFGDILVGVNNNFFTKKNEGVFSQFRKWNDSKLNQECEFHFLRDGKAFNVKVVYGEIPDPEVVKINELGFSIQEIRSIDYYDYDLPLRKGVLISEIDSGGRISGSYFDEDAVMVGDVLVEFDGVPIKSLSDFHQELSKARSSKKKLLLLKTLNGHFTNYAVIRPKFH